MKGFLYGQTEFNLLKNAIHLKDYLLKAKEEAFSFLSITDSNLYGCYKFYNACLEANIQPIIGLEITFLDEDGKDSKILAYAKNQKGYSNLLKISTFLNTNSLPTGIDFLLPYADYISFIMVFNDSILNRYYRSRSFQEMKEYLLKMNQLVDFYVGYSYTNRLDLLTANQEIKQYCEQISIKVLPLHNCRYLKNEDTMIYEALTKIAGEPVEVADYEDYSFDAHPMMTEELEQFVQSIDLNLFSKTTYLPQYPKTKGGSALEYLRALCEKGLAKRLSGQVLSNYQQRLNYELEIINKMGYCDYFLIVWDFILFAKKKGILVGPGRGSAAGSLVAFCLGITEIDPLKYDLLFERFLNPERISMPDIDTDFPDTRRDEVISYVQELYGKEHVCNISAYNTFLMRSSIRDLGRINKMDSLRLDEMIKLVESAESYDTLLEQFKERRDIYDFLYIVKGLEGLPRHISTHAAGIIISSKPLNDIIPLQTGINGLYQSQFEAIDLEKIGLLKMDFLGIRNLTIIDEVMKLIPHFDMNQLRKIPLNDPKTYQLLQQADTLGVFQLESDGIRRVLRNLKCEKFDDLVAVLALYRPGPMDNIDEFIARRHGKPFAYPNPVLEPILKGTYGIIVYQEQIMMIAQNFAGFTLGQADLLRRAVSKKKNSELEQLEEQFIAGAIKKGYDVHLAVDIYQYILKFANYGFNKSHTVAYGLLAYQMAYLKANYFNIFIAKILNNVIGSSQALNDYIQYAKSHGVVTFPPNINISTSSFEVHQMGLFMPLNAIHSIGETTAKEIVKERMERGLFQNFSDFKARTNLNVNILEALIYSGALDCFGQTKKQMISAKESYSEIFNRHLDDVIEDTSEYDFHFLRQKEIEYLGFAITYDLFKERKQLFKQWQADFISYQGHRGIVALDKIKEIKTKNNDQMLVGTLNDDKNQFDFVIFPAELSKITFQISLNQLYCIDYRMEKDKKTGRNKIIIRNMMQVC